MSHLAIDARDEIVLATEVKDGYLLNETLDSPYRCVFCDIAVRPHAYQRDDYRTEAYFKIIRDKHLSGCPYGSTGDWSGSNRSATRTIFDEKLFLPHELIAARAASLGTVSGPGGPGIPGALVVDISKRIRDHGHLLKSGGFAATSLLERVVEAWKAARAICYKKANETKAANPHIFVRNKLKQYDLTLFGAKLNYSRAFHNFTSPWSGPGVHHGRAKVYRTANGFELSPTDVVTIEGAEVAYPGKVSVTSQVFLSNKMSAQLVAQLNDAATMQLVVHWFGYGTLPTDSPAHLQISDSALLYIRDM